MLKKIIPTLILTSILTACGGSNGEDSNSHDSLSFNISSAQSLALGNSTALKTKTTSTAYKINTNDDIEEVSKTKITAMRIFGEEAFFEVYKKDSHIPSYYVVQKDNSHLKLDVKAMPIHQTDNGLILFGDGSTYDAFNQTIKPLDTILPNPTVQTASGNFAIITSYINNSPVNRIYDTVTGNQYPVDSCNGPRLVALSPETAAIDDCSSELLINMSTGKRSTADIQMFNGESLFLGNNDGAYILMQETVMVGENQKWIWNLHHLDELGKKTNVITNDLNTSAECMNCFNKNQELYASSEWIAVKGIDRVTVKNKITNSEKNILNDLDVIFIDLKNDELTYVGSLKGQPNTSVSGVFYLNSEIDNRHNRHTKLSFIESYN